MGTRKLRELLDVAAELKEPMLLLVESPLGEREEEDEI